MGFSRNSRKPDRRTTNSGWSSGRRPTTYSGRQANYTPSEEDILRSQSASSHSQPTREQPGQTAGESLTLAGYLRVKAGVVQLTPDGYEEALRRWVILPEEDKLLFSHMIRWAASHPGRKPV